MKNAHFTTTKTNESGFKYNPAGFSQIQSKRGKAGGLKSGVTRASTNTEKRLKARSMAFDGATQTAIAVALKVSQGTISNWLKAVK